ncbi:MAG TPA: hypothetical protein VL127_19895 [Bryobacteraceae bacterium]|nr:hypothetical protein [Bryobacteraceae bacterium]
MLLTALAALTVSTNAQPANTDAAGAPTAVDHTPPDGPYYPGLPKSKTRLQATLGDFTVRFYGTLLLNISTAGTAQVGQDVPLWPLPGSSNVTFPDGTTKRAGLVHDTIFTARQSILGLQVTSAKPLEGWTTSGLVEIDFYGSRPVDPGLQPQDRVLNQPRLRRAYLQLDKGTWKIVAGQDKMIIAPLDPISLSHVAIPLGASAGDLWAWLPQLRVENRQKFGATTTLFQIGILRPSFGDQRLGDQAALNGNAVDSTFSGFGERSGQPFYQARMALSHPINGRNATVGAGAHYGREQVGAKRTIDSWAFTVDATLPVSSRFIFRGEGFVGSNLVPFDGGIIQGVGFVAPLVNTSNVILTPAKISKIGAGGGWVEGIVPLTLDNKNVFYAGAGTDDPRDRNLLPGSPRSKNSFVWASYFRKLGPDVTAAVEWSFWDFRTRSFTTAGTLGPRAASGRGNVLNIALAYQF